MTTLNLKEKIVDLFDQASREEQAFLAILSDEQRAVVGTPEHWSAKDIIIHIAVWKEHMVKSLEAEVQGLPYTAFNDFDKSNLEIFNNHRYDTWTQAIKLSEKAVQELVRKTQSLYANDLTNTQLLSFQRDRPLWWLIVMNGFYHPIDHLSRYYIQHGMEHEGLNYGTQIQEEAAELLKGLDDSPGWLGCLAYNLACHYAQAEEKEKARQILEEALQLSPQLLEWSKQDPDLASIREETVL
jgi:tetratricopeptide (TPR) repeat protein